tara:strand:+ start:3211 stop:3624 length:414 start_codon:yes stop_codon:yes gene_type:complete
MQYWLFKSEPSAWSWNDHIKAGIAEWDGVRNYQANNNMKAMKIRDKGFFYHSVKEKSIVGIVEVVKQYYPDSSDASGRFGMVDLRALSSIENPVTLSEIKREPKLATLALIRQSRLSVVPIKKEEWKILCSMAGVAA